MKPMSNWLYIIFLLDTKQLNWILDIWLHVNWRASFLGQNKIHYKQQFDSLFVAYTSNVWGRLRRNKVEGTEKAEVRNSDFLSVDEAEQLELWMSASPHRGHHSLPLTPVFNVRSAVFL